MWARSLFLNSTPTIERHKTMPKYADSGLTSGEAPTSGSPMKKMFDAHAKEHPAHISGTNTTGQYTGKNPEKGKLGNRHKQA